MSERFRQTEPARTIVFGPGALERAEDLLGEAFTLLTTPRAVQSAPELAARAQARIDVPAGAVEAVAASLRSETRGDRLVALGGGRVIDVAKALAAAEPPREVVAIPTSLSAAEMTGVHRHAQGVPEDTPRVRPAAVVNDPALSASQPPDLLAASTANATGHAVMAWCSDAGTPIARAVAHDALRRLVDAWSEPEPDRPALALGALMAGWAIDATGLGFHHALAQTAVRAASLGHGQANAALLPATVRAARSRRPEPFERLDAELGMALEAAAEGLRDRAGADLGRLATDEELLAQVIDTAARRPELAVIAPRLERTEVEQIYRHSLAGH